MPAWSRTRPAARDIRVDYWRGPPRSGSLFVMFHIEVRQFPHSGRRFNMTPADVGHFLEAWVAGRPVALGERRWHPQQARLTILEGPELADHQLSIGRGWRAAQRDAADVTERLLGEAREAFAGAGADTSRPPGPSELTTLLGPQSETLLGAWRRAAERHPERSPSECLSLAEAELASASKA